MRQPSIGVVSHLLPPGRSGYQIMLDELLRDVPAEEVVLAGVGVTPWGSRRRLPIPIFRYPSRRFERRLADAILLGGHALARVPGALPPVRRVFSTLDPLLPFAARWARTAGAELWVYAIDLHAEGFWGISRLKPLMKRWVREALEQATRAFGLSEVMVEWLRTEGATGRVEVLPPLVTVNPAPPPPAGSRRSVLFLGSVYTANAAPLKWIENASTDIPGLELRLGTYATDEALRRLGLDPTRWKISPLGPTEVRDAVARAHWTIAALDPDFVDRRSLAVAWPTKLRDYLGAGRPVLCITAPDYALGRLAANRSWALVADDPASVHAALRLTQSESGEDHARRCEAASQFAREQMNNATVGATFRAELLAGSR